MGSRFIARGSLFLFSAWAMVAPYASSARVIVTPRFSGYFDNTNQRSSGVASQIGGTNVDEIAALNQQFREIFGPTASYTVDDVKFGGTSKQDFFAMLGSSVTVTLGGSDRTQVTATALYGKGNSRITAISSSRQALTIQGFTVEDQVASNGAGKARDRRLDLELTLQTRLNETFSLLGGLRYEQVRGKARLDEVVTSSSNISNLIGALLADAPPQFLLTRRTSTFRFRTSARSLSLRMGGVAYVPITEADELFVSGLAQINFAPKESVKVSAVVQPEGFVISDTFKERGEVSAGPDITVGYIHRFGRRVALDLRYRGIFYFPVTGRRSFTDPRVNHGLSLGLALEL